jgi:hypothetical protein
VDRRIDFVIAGAQKSGSTSLHGYLRQHPDIFLPAVKEIPFFLKDEAYEQGTSYLDRFYSDLRDEKVIGLAHAHILSFPWTASRMRTHNPRMKVLAVLRNPIDRAHSAYWHARRHGWEECETFEEALSKEKERRVGSYVERANFSYVGHGYYAERLKYFIDTFSRENVKAVLTEDLAEHGKETLSQILEWLGVDPACGDIDLRRRANLAAMPRLMWLQRLIKSRNTPLKQLYYRLIPEGLRFYIRHSVAKRIIELNLSGFEYPAMRLETRERLAEHFRPYNEMLAELIGRDLGDWR